METFCEQTYTALLNLTKWLREGGIYLSGTNEADSVEMFHGLSSFVSEQLKQIDFLLENLRLRVDDAHC